MKTMCFPAHRSNDFVATHALGHINLSQRAFLEKKLRWYLLDYFFCGEQRNSEIFILLFSVRFLDACKPLAENTYALEAELLATHGLSVSSISLREWPSVVSFYEVLLKSAVAYFLGVNLEFVLPRCDFRIQHEEFRGLVFTYFLIKL